MYYILYTVYYILLHMVYYISQREASWQRPSPVSRAGGRPLKVHPFIHIRICQLRIGGAQLVVEN